MSIRPDPDQLRETDLALDGSGIIQALSRCLERALREDVRSGDITSKALKLTGVPAVGKLRVKQDGVMAGLQVIPHLYALPYITQRELFIGPVDLYGQDRDWIEVGTIVAELEGEANALLQLERSLLNMVSHLSGIATLTRAYVDAVAGTSAKICDTRKTLSGMRQVEKYAVMCGGGVNHRMGLFDEVMIKENHLMLAGKNLQECIEDVRKRVGASVRMTCEVETFEQFEVALDSDADILLLDEFSPEDLRRAVALRDERRPNEVLLEASGGVNLSTVRAIAECGVDRISVGALTHSAPSLDMSFKIFPNES